MGWAAEDTKNVEAAKVWVSNTKGMTYTLLGIVKKIAHPEKGPDLVHRVENIRKELDYLEIQLGR